MIAKAKPIDIFAWVLRHSYRLFGLDDFKTFLMVSKSFRKLLKEYSRAFVLYVLELTLNTSCRITRNWFKYTFFPVVRDNINSNQFEEVRFVLSVSKNRIKNASCNQKLQHWQVTENRGNGWVVQDWKHDILKNRPEQMAFCGSYGKCTMLQTVDLSTTPDLSKLDHKFIITAGTYVARRNDCPCTAWFSVVLLDDEEKELFKYSKEVSEELPSSCEKTKNYCYRLIETQIENPDAITKAKKLVMTLSTKDNKFWAGHYGARFTDMFVRIIPFKYIY